MKKRTCLDWILANAKTSAKSLGPQSPESGKGPHLPCYRNLSSPAELSFSWTFPTSSIQDIPFRLFFAFLTIYSVRS